MQRAFLIILACLALVIAGCGDDSSTSATSADTTAAESPQNEEDAAAEEAKEKEEAAPELPQPKIPSGPPPKELVVKDVKKGSGPTAKAGDTVGMEYVGVVYTTKEQFDANWESGEPFTFKLGGQEVIKGWDQGIPGMKVGGERELIIPPALAYGNQAVYPSIPANATLVFLTRLVSVK